MRTNSMMQKDKKPPPSVKEGVGGGCRIYLNFEDKNRCSTTALD
jgi:hypothetical protein